MSATIDFPSLKRSSNRDARKVYQQAEEITKGTLSNTYGGVGKSFVNHLRAKYRLTDFQLVVISSLQREWEVLARRLNPDKIDGIDEIKDVMTEDDELVLYRESSIGLIKITIHEEELVTRTVLGKKRENNLVEFNELSSVDGINFESIAYRILCK